MVGTLEWNRIELAGAPLLSGSMFPFDGMRRAARSIVARLPLTHFVRPIRGIMLRGAELIAYLAPTARKPTRRAFCGRLEPEREDSDTAQMDDARMDSVSYRRSDADRERAWVRLLRS